jgi:hypothetical protein
MVQAVRRETGTALTLVTRMSGTTGLPPLALLAVEPSIQDSADIVGIAPWASIMSNVRFNKV